MGKPKEFKIRTRFVFEGHFKIVARTKAEAIEFVEKDCGMVSSHAIHSNLPDEMVDWDFPVHPEKKIIRK